MHKEPPFLAAIWYWFAAALFFSGVGIILYQSIYWLLFDHWPHIPLYVIFGMPPLLELEWSRVLLAWIRAPEDRRILHTLMAPVLNLPVAALVMAVAALPYAFASWLQSVLEQRQAAFLQKRRAARRRSVRADNRDRFPN